MAGSGLGQHTRLPAGTFEPRWLKTAGMQLLSLTWIIEARRGDGRMQDMRFGDSREMKPAMNMILAFRSVSTDAQTPQAKGSHEESYCVDRVWSMNSRCCPALNRHTSEASPSMTTVFFVQTKLSCPRELLRQPRTLAP